MSAIMADDICRDHTETNSRHKALAAAASRASDRINLENQKRWSILVAIIECKYAAELSAAGKLVVPGSLNAHVVAHVAAECGISPSQVYKVWSEFMSQKHDNDTNKFIFSMISNLHGDAMKEHQSWLPDEHKHGLRRYASRWDSGGREYPIQELVELIAKVNNETGQCLHLRVLSGEILRRYQLWVPKSTLSCILNDFHFDKEISHVKPVLTLKHLRLRLHYVLQQVDQTRTIIVGERVCFKFNEHKNRVELDEKMFKCENEETVRRRRPEDPILPPSHVISKEHIPKLMFLAAVGVPQYYFDANGNKQWFDGKIGIWPLAERVPAKAASSNRPAGTLEVKAVSVTADYFLNIMTREDDGVLDQVRKKMPWLQDTDVIEFVVAGAADVEDADGDETQVDNVDDDFNIAYVSAADVSKMRVKQLRRFIIEASIFLGKTGIVNEDLSSVLRPVLAQRASSILNRLREKNFTAGDAGSTITVQVDNAKPYVGGGNIRLLNIAGHREGDGFKLVTKEQPPRSPDVNKLDMSVFRSLDFHVGIYKAKSKNIEQLAAHVVQAFESYPTDSLLRCYAQTFALYREILKANGGIDFKSPHGHIRQHELRGEDIVDLYVDVSLVREAEQWLESHPLPEV
jgi:hypothetical protein